MEITTVGLPPKKPYTIAGQVCEVRDVSQTFRKPSGEENRVLRDVNFIVPNYHRDDLLAGQGQGQVWAILGRSGRGKTTLGRILTGLDKPTTGEVLLNDERSPVRSGEVGFVFQDSKVFEDLTVRQNLEYAAYQGLHREHAEHLSAKNLLRRFLAWNLRRGEIRDRAMQYVEDFDLAGVLDQKPDQLSGGQRQRLATLMQVLCSSKFIVLDEPFSGQDPPNKLRCCEIIKRVALMDEQETLFVITHDVACAVYCADTLLPVGWEKDESGKFKPGATTFKPYELAELGLAWQDPSILHTREFMELVNEIEYVWYPNM